MICMILSLSACGGTPDAAQTPEPEATPAEPSVSAEELYKEASASLEAKKYKDAYEKLVEAAGAGSAEAMEALARGIIIDTTFSGYTSGNGKRLVEVCTQRADEGDPWGILTLAYCYMSGFGTSEQNKDAFKVLEKASETDNPEVQGLALNDMGYMLSNGLYVQKDGKKAMEAYKKSAELGNAYAMGNIGAVYAYGTLYDKDDDTAVSWFEKALEAGDDAAREWVISMVDQLGNDYLFPKEGVEPDYEKAKMYYGLAEEYGDKDALFVKGVMHH